MEELLKKIDDCSDKAEKYDLTIEYMENAGIVFKAAKPDHINKKYRILKNDSSIFVYVDHFKMNLCVSDRDKVEKRNLGLSFSINYKNKGKEEKDNVRPWTCEFSGASMLEKVVEAILDKVKIQNINYPMKPLKIDSGMVHCPNCSYVFEKAKRCPECGQLIDYNNDTDTVAEGKES
jgi:rubrerythrin